MDPAFLKILRCPESSQPLSFASDSILESVNKRIRQGSCRNQLGNPVSAILDNALIRDDGAKLYPVRNGFPVLLADESIPVL